MKVASRKFMLAVLAILLTTALVFLGKVTGDNYVTVLVVIVPSYLGLNLGEKVIGGIKGEKTNT